MKIFHTIPSCLVLLLSFTAPADGQDPGYGRYTDHPWVDSIMETLSLREQVAQLIWVTSPEGSDPAHVVAVDHLVRDPGIGGVVFGNLQAIEYFRSVSAIPIAAGVIKNSGTGFMNGNGGGTTAEPGPEHEWEQEGSFPCRVEEETVFWEELPDPMVLDAVEDDFLLLRTGSQLATGLASLGIQVLVAPEAQGGTGERTVSATFREHNILYTSIHKDSGNTEIAKALSGTTGFTGMIPADLNGTEALAFLFEPQASMVEEAIQAIADLIEKGSVDPDLLTRKVRLMLAFKYWSMVQMPDNLEDGSWDKYAWHATLRDIYAGALTVLKNDNEVIPIGNLERTSIATVAINRTAMTPFQEMAGNYTRMDHYQWNPREEEAESLMMELQSYDLVLAGLYTEKGVPGNPGDPSPERDAIEKLVSGLSGDQRLIVVCFNEINEGTPCLSTVREPEGILITYQQNRYTEELAAQLLFGGIPARGRLPVEAGEQYPAGSGINTPGGLRLQYAFPESAGIGSRSLESAVDSIVGAGLEAGAFPGCEVMAARKGMVVFHKTYGHHTYDHRVKVDRGDLYDLASVTKVSGPLAGLMVLEGAGLFSHSERLGAYCPSMKRSDKADLWIKDILAHQAGLYPWIPYWMDAVRKNGKYKGRFISNAADEKHPLTVADHLYLNDGFRKKIYRTIRKSELGEQKYLYSGLSFFLFPEMIEDLSGDRYEDFLTTNIYHRIGAWDLVYNPHRFYPLASIVPTEYDSLFRKQQVHGYVHDEGAAMMGGFSGNAGLFATAGDLMKLMEMYRRMGSYGGEQIIPAGVVQEYTRYQFPENLNRRGLGFDKPLLDERDGTPGDYPCPGASPGSFGHSGFTGTFVWVDPEHELTYVFLSNRVYPTRENNLISEMDIRTSILQTFYDAIDAGDDSDRSGM